MNSSRLARRQRRLLGKFFSIADEVENLRQQIALSSAAGMESGTHAIVRACLVFSQTLHEIERNPFYPPFVRNCARRAVTARRSKKRQKVG